VYYPQQPPYDSKLVNSLVLSLGIEKLLICDKIVLLQHPFSDKKTNATTRHQKIKIPSNNLNCSFPLSVENEIIIETHFQGKLKCKNVPLISEKRKNQLTIYRQFQNNQIHNINIKNLYKVLEPE